MIEKPLLVVTMGDAAGIGPEIIAKAMAEPEVHARCRPIVIGAPWAIQDTVGQTDTPLLVRANTSLDDAGNNPGIIDVFPVGTLRREEINAGQLSAAAGKASVEYVETAAYMALQQQIAGIVTCPINKEAIHLGGAALTDIGHQEILARIFGATLTATMLITKGLRVAHLSTHKSLTEAVRYVTEETVLAKLRLTTQSMIRWGLEHPRIAVAGLNPHGGEGGLLGREEIDEIAPAIAEAQAQGIDARGPFPADSVFHRAIAGEFDVVLAMYHDQGHIAVKVHDFEDSVTVTMGIPCVRTSVDHGTAFDIAGKGVANHRSLVRAIGVAADLSTHSLVPSGTRRTGRPVSKILAGLNATETLPGSTRIGFG